MLGIAFFKGQPTDYIIKYAGGRAVRQGLGQSFYYITLNTQVAVIPTSTRDASFVFNELTNNFQSVTLQGQFTYRISDPAQAATQLNFAWNTRRQEYAAKDPDSLPPIDPNEPVPDDPGPLLPDTPETLPPPPVEPMPGPDEPGNVPVQEPDGPMPDDPESVPA